MNEIWIEMEVCDSVCCHSLEDLELLKCSFLNLTTSFPFLLYPTEYVLPLLMGFSCIHVSSPRKDLNFLFHLLGIRTYPISTFPIHNFILTLGTLFRHIRVSLIILTSLRRTSLLLIFWCIPFVHGLLYLLKRFPRQCVWKLHFILKKVDETWIYLD